MNNQEFLQFFRQYVQTVNRAPRQMLIERYAQENIFSSSWSEKGGAERREKRLEGQGLHEQDG